MKGNQVKVSHDCLELEDDVLGDAFQIRLNYPSFIFCCSVHGGPASIPSKRKDNKNQNDHERMQRVINVCYNVLQFLALFHSSLESFFL